MIRVALRNVVRKQILRVEGALAASALPMALSACGEDEVQCPDGEILVDGVCVDAED